MVLLNHSKTVVMLVTIIGAGAGISHAVAELFGQKGFKIALCVQSIQHSIVSKRTAPRPGESTRTARHQSVFVSTKKVRKRQ